MAHTFDVERADRLDDPSRYQFCSRDELIARIGSAERVLDLGSGTGFYTNDVAPHVSQVIALDLQGGMHDRYREKEVSPSVRMLTGHAEWLPVTTDSVEVVYSTMTVHEIATPSAIREIRRVLDSGGRFVAVDWSAAGEGEAGPPIEERWDARSTAEWLREAGFGITHCEERPETYVVVGTRPA